MQQNNVLNDLKGIKKVKYFVFVDNFDRYLREIQEDLLRSTNYISITASGLTLKGDMQK